MKEQMIIIGNNIRDLRRAKGCSQEALANGAGISMSNLRKIENGTANPTVQTLCLISKELNVAFVDILYPQNKEMKYIRDFYNLITTLPTKETEMIVSMIKTIVDIVLSHNK